MKKLLSTVAMLTTFAVPAKANELNFNPYVGVDYQSTSANYEGGGDDRLDGFNIHVGNRFTDHLAVELGYFRTKKLSESFVDPTFGPVLASGHLSGVTLDALGYLPVTDDKTVELIGTVGVSYLRGDVDVTVSGVRGSADESELSFRVGAGAQVNVTENVNLRGLVRYQTADLDDNFDNLWIATVGVNYSF